MDFLNDMSIQTLVWLFIVTFLLHDLEEIIWVEVFAKKYKTNVLHIVPKRLKQQLDHMLTITSGQFAFAVLLEFIVFIPITYVAAEQANYFLFLAINTLFLLHVFTHLGQSLLLKKYTPGVVSAVVLVLPYTLFLFSKLFNEQLITWSEVLLSIPFGLLVIPLVLLGHQLGKKLVN